MLSISAVTDSGADPLLIAIVSVRATVLAGIVGAIWQSTRENRRWIRNERLKVYAAFQRISDMIRNESAKGKKERADAQQKIDAANSGVLTFSSGDLDAMSKTNEQGMAVLARLEEELYVVLSRLRIVASRGVNDAGVELGAAMEADNRAFARAVEEYMTAARKDLRIPNN